MLKKKESHGKIAKILQEHLKEGDSLDRYASGEGDGQGKCQWGEFSAHEAIRFIFNIFIHLFTFDVNRGIFR